MNLKSLYGLYASHPQGKWIMVPENVQALYKFIKDRPQIKNVLDLGTGIGCSAATIALALKDAERDGKVHTVEQFEKCYQMAQDLVPEELRPHLEYHHSLPKVWQNPLIPYEFYSIFTELPEGDFDMIIVDGPGPFFEGEGENEQYVDLPNGDVMKLLIEGKIKPGTFIAWDGRLKALQNLERYYGDNFFLVRPANKDDFNVLERKNNDPSFNDLKLLQMHEIGYSAN